MIEISKGLFLLDDGPEDVLQDEHIHNCTDCGKAIILGERYFVMEGGFARMEIKEENGKFELVEVKQGVTSTTQLLCLACFDKLYHAPFHAPASELKGDCILVDRSEGQYKAAHHDRRQ